MKPIGCEACHGTGWVRFGVEDEHGRTRPYAGACHCELGRFLSSPREGTAAIPNPVVVRQVSLEQYHAAIRRQRA